MRKLHALCEKSVAVAVPVENAAAAAEKTRFGVSLGVEAHKLEAVVRAVSREGQVMLLGHRVNGGNIQLVLDVLDRDLVRLVGLLGFERRQGHAAAGNHRAARRVEHVAADRADVQPGTAHIRRAVDVFDLLARQQLGHGNAQSGRERLQQRHIGKAAPRFP